MEKIVFELTLDKIQEAVLKSVETITGSTYSNPIKDAVERAIKEKSGDIEIMVKQIIAESMSNPKFKEKLGEVVLANLVSSVMKK